MNKNNQIIGFDTAKTCFYLPTPPIIPENWSHTAPDAVQHLIEENGNHWRKILTIMAKVSVTDTGWKSYRDHLLLKQAECLSVNADKLNPNANLHIICGQQSALKLSLNSELFKPIAPNSNYVSKHTQQAIYLCPYLDYRQFPNLQINMLRAALSLPPLN